MAFGVFILTYYGADVNIYVHRCIREVRLMPYNENLKDTNLRYFKNNQRRIALNWLKDDYEKRVAPAIKRSGKPTSTFIKEAVEEKLVRDLLLEENSKYNLEYTLDRIKRIIVRDIPKVLKDDCKKIIMYGSCARGNYNNNSDVDIAILTNSDREGAKKYDSKIDEIATTIEIDTMAIVNFVLLPKSEYEEKNSWYPYFINIKNEGIVLYEH